MDKLWYRKPAKEWNEALPIGNGRMGAMVFGMPVREKIQVDESTFWSGAPSEENNRKDVPGLIGRVRELLLEERYEEAEPLVRQLVGNKNNYGTNLPAGNLFVDLCTANESCTEYSRCLDLVSGVAETDFILEDTKYHREVFISHPHKLLALKFAADRTAAVNAVLRYEGIENDISITGWDGRDFFIHGNAFETTHSDGKTGVELFGRIRILTEGGTIKYHSGYAEVKNADSMVLYMTLETTMLTGHPDTLCKDRLDLAELAGYERVKAEHVGDFSLLYRRMDLRLGNRQPEGIPTDERIEWVRNGGEDPGLVQLLFQYGRYLLIAGSREDSPLPTHMGGIWNDNTYCRIGCTQDMHIDLNIQMQYWLAEPCNLTECSRPLFRWLKETVVPSGEKTAAQTYHARGWTAHVVSNPWGFTSLGWEYEWGVWALGGLWASIHLWEHYLYTKDETFLREYAYPVLEGAARFALDYLFEDPATGLEMTGPSYSPENKFLFENKAYFLSLSTTCDVLFIREIFEILLKAADVLHNEDGMLAFIAQKLRKLPPYRIGRYGQLQEWFRDYEEALPGHRHTSHLLGLYPLAQITPEETPELAQAAKTSLIRRRSADWEITSWAAAIHLSSFARLQDPVSAVETLRQVFEQLVTPNLFSVMGPKDSWLYHTWELDGNTGLTSAIGELLLQSHRGVIHLLPALPETWKEGGVSGICARGGFEVDMEWSGGILSEVRLRAKLSGRCTVQYKGTTVTLEVEAGKAYRANDSLVFELLEQKQ